MEEKELLEIEAREREQAKKNIEEMARRKKMGDICLLYKDKLNLGNRRTCYPAYRISPEILFYLYEKVLLSIPPCSSSREFEQRTDFSVSQVLEWRKKGWVETFLTHRPSDYVDLDYLDELILVSPARSVRSETHASFLVGGQDRINSIVRRGKVLLQGAKTPKELRQIFGDERAERFYYGGAATIYTSLCVFGLSEIAHEIIRRCGNDMNAGVFGLELCGAFLVSPLLFGLGKTTAYPDQLKSLASEIYQSGKPAADTFFVPCWLADLYEYLGATVPLGMDIDEISAVRKHSEVFIRAVKGYEDEIDKAVRKSFKNGEADQDQKQTIIAKREESRRTWHEEVVPAFKDLSFRRKAWSLAMTGSIVTTPLVFSALHGILDLQETIRAAALAPSIKKLVDPVAEFLSAFFECNPIHLGFYKVHRELKRVQSKSG
jgi:hypothetical protein